MLAQIEVWRDNYAPAWTGARPVSGQVYDVHIVERHCACGRTARQLDAVPVIHSARLPDAVSLPVCVVVAHTGTTEFLLSADHQGLRILDWSGECLGYVIFNPVCLLTRRQTDQSPLPLTKDGYQWYPLTIRGLTEEYALLSVYAADHGIPADIVPHEECPLCAPVELADDGQDKLYRISALSGIRYKAGCRTFTPEQALEYWSEDQTDDSASLFRAAILRDINNNHEEPVWGI